MKKTLVAIALIMGVSAGVMANDNDVNVKALDGLKFKLSFDNTASKSSVAIVDEEGNFIYTDFGKASDNYAKVFDLSNLSDGKYSFVVMANGKKVVKDFEIKTEVKRNVNF